MGSTASKQDDGTQPNTILILRSICSAGGVVQVSELCDKQFFPNDQDAKFFLKRQPNYFRLEENKVYAHTSAEICDQYDPKQDDCRVPGCRKFHLCKHFVTGSCKYGTSCTRSHDVHSTHNRKVVEGHRLSDVDDALILSLLKLSCVEYSPTVPGVCTFYNAGGCKNDATCTFLHVCRHYIKGSCTFGEDCRHSHNILDQQPRKVLLNFGIDVGQDPKDLLRMVRFKKGGRGTDVDDTEKRRKGPWRKSTGTSFNEKLHRQPAAADDAKSKKYVCMFHLGGKCNYDENCFNLHTEEPFQWQWKRQNDGKWENFVSSGNLEMEKAFCDPNQNDVNVPRQDSAGKKTVGTVDFSNHENYRITFVGEITPYEIRRIGTRFVSQGWRSALTTWLWYWEDDNGKFVEYGKQSARGTEASICSKTLEEAYRSYCSEEHAGKLHFQTGRSQYDIDFKKMKQVNQSLGSERRVRRRPQFSTKEDINGRIKRQKHASTASSLVPTTWEKDTMPETEDFKLCAVANATDEYGDISRRFQATMPSASIVSIKRVQNVELWEEFCRKRGKMEKKNKGSVREELLFHGTTEKVLDAICQQNFDHRLSGTRVGAKFGQGTYFHKNARYSNSYAKSDANGRKRMFQARVLVGAYTKGSNDLRRPPPKDPHKPLEDFYDTCVDDSANPSIFVTFENNQVYPEYIITYST